MSSKKKVLFIEDLNRDLVEYQEFAKKYNCVHYKLTTRKQLVKDFQSPLLSDVEAIYGSWPLFHPVGGFNKELITNSPVNLQIITVCSVGYEGFDIPQMSFLRPYLKLTNTPHLGSNHVLDLVLYHVLSSFRMFSVFEKELITSGGANTIKTRSNLTHKFLDPIDGQLKEYEQVSSSASSYAFGHHIGSSLPIQSPFGKRLTIVGMGNIGKQIANRLSLVGMKLSYVKRQRLSHEEELKFHLEKYFPTLLELASISDLIVFAVPGTEETRNLFNQELLDLLPETGSRVVNVGRGFIIDDEVLLKGLQTGKIHFAGLDVFNGEPEVDRRLLDRQDVLCTPHIGSATMETYNDSAVYCLRNIDSCLSGKVEDVMSVVN